MRSLPGRRFITHLQPWSCPEPSRAQGRSRPLAHRAARAPAAPGRGLGSVPDAVCYLNQIPSLALRDANGF